MNVVSQFTVYDLVLGDLKPPRPWQYYVSLWTSLQEEKGRWEGMEIPAGYYRGEGPLIQLIVINNFLY